MNPAHEQEGPAELTRSGLPEVEALMAPRPVTAVEWGLERIDRMLDALGRPERSFRSVHVGGTNGKGTAAAAAESVLRAAGVRTGLYTSPPLFEFRDRIVVEGERADPDLLEACARRLRPLAEEAGATFFEAATALAFLAFREAGVERAAVEVGLGGRLDATNVLSPEAVVLTSVAVDHTGYLGETLPEIAAEKAGILAPGVPAAVGPLDGPAERVIEERAAELEAPLLWLGRDARVEDVAVSLEGTSLTYRSGERPDGLPLRTRLVGRHQARNIALAVLALEALDDAPGDGATRAGVEALTWRGRFEVVRAGRGRWVVDSAHNAAAAEALAATLRETSPPGPVVLLLAVLEDKPWREMLRPLLGLASGAVLTVAPSSPSARRWDVASAREELSGLRAEVEADFDRAMSRARELAGAGTVVVTGSCYTAGDALRRLDRAPATSDHD